MLKAAICWLFLPGACLIAQTLVGAGYTAPAPVSVAPGQIVTFYVAGLSSLTGITATLQQAGSVAVPIQSMQPISMCPDATASAQGGCATLAAITVQIPYELMLYGLINVVGVPCPPCAYPTRVFISQNGQAATTIEVFPVSDEVHVLTACDAALGSSTTAPLPGLPCAPLVTHADGTLVSVYSPANVGEEVIAWVFGLGQTNPPTATGQPAKTAPTAETFNLDFNYQVNALPTKPFTGDPDRVPLVPLFAGLAPGYVGLYQVNFIVPPAPPNGIPQCTIPGPFTGPNDAQSNLTVSIGGRSFDGAGICVATQIPVD